MEYFFKMITTFSICMIREQNMRIISDNLKTYTAKLTINFASKLAYKHLFHKHSKTYLSV